MRHEPTNSETYPDKPYSDQQIYKAKSHLFLYPNAHLDGFGNPAAD